MKAVIQEDLIKALLNYLASKPYGEVAGLISALQKAIQDAENSDN